MKTSIHMKDGHPVLQLDEELLREAGFDQGQELDIQVQAGRITIASPEGLEAQFAAAKQFLFDHYGEALSKLAQ